MSLDYLQKADALNALAEISIKTRGLKDWYVSQRVEIKSGNFLAGQYGNGDTPENAILDHWEKLVTDLPSNSYLVANHGYKTRRAVRWGGYMWKDVGEDQL